MRQLITQSCPHPPLRFTSTWNKNSDLKRKSTLRKKSETEPLPPQTVYHSRCLYTRYTHFSKLLHCWEYCTLFKYSVITSEHSMPFLHSHTSMHSAQYSNKLHSMILLRKDRSVAAVHRPGFSISILKEVFFYRGLLGWLGTNSSALM